MYTNIPSVITIGIVVFILGLGIGGFFGLNLGREHEVREQVPVEMPEIDSHGHNLPHGHGHMHGTLVLPEGGPIPRVDLIVRNDPSGGWNLRIITGNFTFAPEGVSRGHVSGEGHAHLYIDGDKITRIYNEWFHVPEEWLSPGAHEFRVTLSTNDHREYVYTGSVISDREVIVVSGN